MSKDKMLCPCCSGKSYKDCCEPYHKGLLPQNALELMRSRYSAYALNIPEYIIKTTHRENRQYLSDKNVWKDQIAEFSKKTIFQGLEIIDFQEGQVHATVTFIAYLSQNNCDATFKEISSFERVNELWLYKKGDFLKF